MAADRHRDELPLGPVDALIDAALAEDLGSGDITSMCCIDATQQAEAMAIARSTLVVCGGAVFVRAFERVDPTVRSEVLVADGALAAPGDCLWRLQGAARALLAAERVALNFVQRMSGTATLTRAFVDELAPGSHARVVGTRKTTPGLRALERHAVRVGGGRNHRDNLASAVMIKDNHISAAGGITAAVERARRLAPHTCRIEVEVATAAQLDEAVGAAVDIVMLDNMNNAQIEEAMHRLAALPAGARPVVEVSGGMTRQRAAELSALGVDIISVGALTHSAPAADISLELGVEPRRA